MTIFRQTFRSIQKKRMKYVRRVLEVFQQFTASTSRARPWVSKYLILRFTQLTWANKI